MRNRRRNRLNALGGSLWLFFSATAQTLSIHSTRAQVPAREPWTVISPFTMMENDSFFHGDDRHYTNGLYAAATSGRQSDCGWCVALAQVSMLPIREAGTTYRQDFFVGQSMFTPQDLSRYPPDAKDRPYGGWLYLGGRLYRENGNVLDRADVSLGIVGPASGADAVQRWWHALHWFGGVRPAGWHDQIKNEPGLVVSGQRQWRNTLREGPIEAEILPQANLSLGNVFTYAGAGATVRIGRGLHADWGPPRIQPAVSGSDFVDFNAIRGIAWSVFAGFEARGVLRNIFLDGNSYQDSANIAKKPLVADLNLGAAVLFNPIALHATYTFRTREFKTQNGNDRFYSFSLSYAY